MTGNDLVSRIEKRLKAVDKSARAASLEAGLSDAFVRNILTGKSKSPRVENFDVLAQVLGTTADWLLKGEGPEVVAIVEAKTWVPSDRGSDGAKRGASTPDADPDVDLSKADHLPSLPNFGGPRDVPVLGTAVGGGDEDGDFRFNGEQIDSAPRPPGIAKRRDVFCLYVENDSMFPKFEPGDRLYLDPNRKAKTGEYIVVELQPRSEGEAGRGYIKRLVKQTPTKLIVSQFNPPKELEFDLDEVKKTYRVIPQDELLGI
jgi:phage repressor protein C with HTH and peptisase S24 domain